MKIDLQCAACGSNKFELGEAETDECSVECGECGHAIGTMGQLKQMLAAEVLRHSRHLRRRSTSPTPCC